MPSSVARLETRTRAIGDTPAGAMRSPLQRMNSSGGLPRYSSRRASIRPSSERVAAGRAALSLSGSSAAGGSPAGRSWGMALFTLSSKAFTVALPVFSDRLIYHAGHGGAPRAPLGVSGGERHPVTVDEAPHVRLDPEALRARSGASRVGEPLGGIAQSLDHRARKRLVISRPHQASVHPIHHHLRQPADGESDDGSPRGDGLDGREAQALGAGR